MTERESVTLAAADVGSLSILGPPAERPTVMAPEPVDPTTPFERAHERIMAAWRGLTGGKDGAFYLLAPEAREWSVATRVIDEPEFEAEWRTRVAHDTNPDHALVILPH